MKEKEKRERELRLRMIDREREIEIERKREGVIIFSRISSSSLLLSFNFPRKKGPTPPMYFYNVG